MWQYADLLNNPIVSFMKEMYHIAITMAVKNLHQELGIFCISKQKDKIMRLWGN